MKNKITYLFILILLCGCKKQATIVNQQIIDDILLNFGTENGYYNYSEDIFSKYKGSDRFIEKFNLRDDEIIMIGKWYRDDGVRYRYNSMSEGAEGLGLGIGFLPNRIFIARTIITYTDINGKILDGDVIYKLGYWKVEDGKLKIKFTYRYIRKEGQLLGEYIDRQKFETKYFQIWKPEIHDQIAIQLFTFYYNKIPKKVKEFYHIDDNDSIRKRTIPALRFNGDDSFSMTLYYEIQPWHKFLMNPDLDDQEYVRNLLIMYYGNGWRYDFEENYFDLNFSKWQ